MLVAPSGRTFADVASFASAAKQRGAELLVISDDGELLRQSQTPLPEGTPEWLSPLIAVLPGQMFARSLAMAKGYDVDRPAGLTKVTETR